METRQNRRRYWTGVQQEVLTDNERDSIIMQIRRQTEEFALTYVWLIRRLRERGVYTTSSEMAAVMAGTRRGPKVDAILQGAYAELAEYARRMEQGAESAC